jgi:hypothetical protein
MSFLSKFLPSANKHANGSTTDAARRRRLQRQVASIEYLEDRSVPSTMTFGPLQFVGDFIQTGLTQKANGAIEVGFIPAGTGAFRPFAEVDGSVAFQTGGSSFDVVGELDAIASGSSVELWSGSQSFDVRSLTSSAGVSLRSGAANIDVGGASFLISDIAFAQIAGSANGSAAVRLQGTLSLPELAGFSIQVSGQNSLLVSPGSGISLTGLTTTVTTPFSFEGITVTPQALTVAYSAADQSLEFYGEVTAADASGDVSWSGNLGTAGSPGLVVRDGAVSALEMTVDSTISAAGLSLSTAGASLAYDPANHDFAIAAGNVSLNAESSLALTGVFHGGGLVIKGGTLQSLDVMVGSGLSVAGLSLNTDNVEFIYDEALAQFEIEQGTVTVDGSGGGPAFTAMFGSNGQPGLVVRDGTLQSVDLSLTGNIAIAGLSLSGAGLALDYQPGQNSFAITSGSVSLSAGTSLAFNGTFVGSGLVLENGALQSLDVAVGSSLSVAGLKLDTDNLEFNYDRALDQFEIQQGTITVDGAAGGPVFTAAFGSPTEPGLVVRDGALQRLDLRLTSTMAVAGLAFSATDLNLDYQADKGAFAITSGTVTATAGGSFSIAGSFTNDGLVIRDGALSELELKVAGEIVLEGLSVSGNNLLFDYNAVGQNFEIDTGTVTVKAGSDLSFTGTFGSQGRPGLVIDHGVLRALDVSLSGGLSVAGLSLNTDNVGFIYDEALAQFEIEQGTVSVAGSNGGPSFRATFGSNNQPGLVVRGGALASLDLNVTGDISVGGVDVAGNGLIVDYNAARRDLEIDAGAVTVKAGSDLSFTGTFGSQGRPGLVIDHGVLEALDVTLSGGLSVAGLSLNTDNVEFIYDEALAQFEIEQGTVSVAGSNGGPSFTATFGSSNQPGLVVQGGVLRSAELTITSDISVAGLTLSMNGLTLNYVAGMPGRPSEFEIASGSVTVGAGTDVSFTGTFKDRGLVIQDGALTSLDLTVTGGFSIGGLSFAAQDLTFDYVAAGGADASIFEMTGGVTVSLPGSTISGTFAGPNGLVIRDGKVQDVDVNINGSITLFGLTLEANNAALDYTAATDQYVISGSVTLSDVFSATVCLGTPSQPGLIVDHGRFDVQNFEIDLSDINLGAFEIQKASLSFQENGGTTMVVGAATVAFPEGWSVGGSMEFVNGKLHDISLAYAGNPGIAVGNTGLMITQMNADVENIDDPSQLEVSGSMTVVLGDKVTIAGKSAAMVEATGNFTCDAHQLLLASTVYMGAYESGNSITALLGTGMGTLDLDWGTGKYSLDASLSLYGGAIKVDGDLQFDNQGDIVMVATAAAQVPKGVPLIGNKTLSTMDFEFTFDTSTKRGSVAVWTSVDVDFMTIDLGFQYQFNGTSSGTFSVIDDAQVKGYEQQMTALAQRANALAGSAEAAATDAVAIVIPEFTQMATTFYKAGVSGVKPAASTVANAASKAASAASSAASTVGSAVSSTASTVGSAVSSATSTASSTAKSVVKSISHWF